MAKKNKTITFKKAQISLEDNTITEFTKEGVLVYSLSDVLDNFSGDDQFVDITFKENVELLPDSREG